MKIIVFMKNWVGDTFFQFPAIHLIKEKYPLAEITCIAPPRCRELLLSNPDIAHVIEFDEKTLHRSWVKRAAFIRQLRAQGPWEQAYLFHRSRSRAMLLACAGVKARYGYGKGRSFWLTRSIAEPMRSLHHVDYFLELLRGCGYEIPENTFYQLPVAENALLKANQLLSEVGIAGQKHFICFHLGANWSPKRWPPEHFAELAEKIYQTWQTPILVTGSEGDKALWEEMKLFLKNAHVVSLIGKTTLDSLAGLYSQAAFVVSGDSGPMHIATAVGAPVVALFGPTDSSLTGPRGQGDSVVLSYSPPGVKIPFLGDEKDVQGWMKQISPEQVFKAIQDKGWGV